MAEVNLGKVRITFEGDWDSSKEYKLLSVVNNSYGVKYISKQDVPKDTELSNTDYWEPLNGDFVSQYQGAHDSDPSKRNDGSDLQEGDLYWYTGDDKALKFYDGSDWKIYYPSTEGYLQRVFVSDDADAKNLQYILVQTKDKAITITLPKDPIDKTQIVIADGSANANNNNITIDGNGKDIEDDSTFVVDIDRANAFLTFNDDKDKWEVNI